MGMTTASCVMINGVGKDGKLIARPYTPTSLNDDKGPFLTHSLTHCIIFLT